MRLIVFALCVLASNVAAQDTEFEFELPTSPCSFTGVFTQSKSLKGLAKPLVSEGVFYFHCNHGVIWSTLNPLPETLVLRQDGNGFVARPENTQKLASRHGKFLGKLLNTLMAGDADAIGKQFEVDLVNLDSSTYQLTPRKRSLKRGIKKLLVSIPSTKVSDQETVAIEIIDRNQQTTEIKSQRTDTFDSESSAQLLCQAIPTMQAEHCNLLISD